jgi:hypothetical protein
MPKERARRATCCFAFHHQFSALVCLRSKEWGFGVGGCTRPIPPIPMIPRVLPCGSCPSENWPRHFPADIFLLGIKLYFCVRREDTMDECSFCRSDVS